MTWPLITHDNVQKHLKETMVTHEGHLKRVRQELCSTKKKHQAEGELEVEENQFSIKQGTKCHEVYALIMDTHAKAFTDITGPFWYQSSHDNRYIFVLYTYDLNEIMMKCMKNRGDSEMEGVFEKCYARLEKVGIKPTMNLLDNECLAAIVSFFARVETDYQLAPPGCH